MGLNLPAVQTHSQRLLESTLLQTLVRYHSHPTEAAELWRCLSELEHRDQSQWQLSDAGVSFPDPEAEPLTADRTDQWWTDPQGLSPLTSYRWCHGSGLNQSRWLLNGPHWFPQQCPQVVEQVTWSVEWRQERDRYSPPPPPHSAEGWRSPGLQPKTGSAQISHTCIITKIMNSILLVIRAKIISQCTKQLSFLQSFSRADFQVSRANSLPKIIRQKQIKTLIFSQKKCHATRFLHHFDKVVIGMWLMDCLFRTTKMLLPLTR